MLNYIEKLIKRGEVNVVDREVDPKFELAAVIAASQRQSERPIIFNHVKNTKLPVISNVYGSHNRLCELIGTSRGNFCQQWQSLLDTELPGMEDYEEEVPEPNNLVEGKLSDLPQITYCERDAGPYITAGIFLAKDPETGIPNLSFCRTYMEGDKEIVVRLAPPHDLIKYHAKAEAKNEGLEVAILIGAPTEVFLGACASVPTDVDEMAIAARIRGGKIPMRKCSTIDLSVPAETQVVIEGKILPNVRRKEGPFGEFLGYYVGVNENHVFEISRVSWLDNGYFHGLLCGFPEDLRALEVSFASRVYRQLVESLPGILDVSCSPSPMHTIVRIKPQYEGHAKHVIMKTFTCHFQYNKICIVVDEDVDIHNFDDVWWAVITRCKVDEKLTVLSDVPGFFRDEDKIYGSRLGIDATKMWGKEKNYERKRIPGVDEINLKDYLS